MNLVSVLVPCYNQACFLESCILSIVNQTYVNLEILLSDDGSQDGSLDIIKWFEKRDLRIRNISSSENLGLVYNFNKLFDNAKGEYICFFSGDDIMHPEKIEHQVSYLNRRRDVQLVHHSAVLMDEDSVEFGVYQKGFIPNVDPMTEIMNFTTFNFKKHRTALPTTFLAHREYFLSSRYSSKFKRKHELYFIAENHLKNKSPKWLYIDYPLINYRVHKNNFSSYSLDVDNINFERLLLISELRDNYGQVKFYRKQAKQLLFQSLIFANIVKPKIEGSVFFRLKVNVFRSLVRFNMYWKISKILFWIYALCYKKVNSKYIVKI